MNDYLWDGSGPPDPEVVRLETLLGALRAPEPAGARPAAPRRKRRLVLWSAFVAAAALVLTSAGAWWARRPSGPAWEVTLLHGEGATARQLHVGQWLETDASSRARLKVGTIGEVEAEPRTRLRLDDAGGGP